MGKRLLFKKKLDWDIKLGFKMDVWGDYACFSRPESKVERFSYPVINPSAARGVLDAIYSKNIEFYWQVDRIEILRPVSFIALKRNEVKDKISNRSVMSAMKNGEFSPIIVDATRESSGSDVGGRTQRQTMALKNVKYRIHARIVPRTGFYDRQTALNAQFMRRLESGKCFAQPYFGQREFVAYFSPPGDELPVSHNQKLGYMVYDVFNLDKVSTDISSPYISLFEAEICEGVLEVPPWNDSRVKKPDRR